MKIIEIYQKLRAHGIKWFIWRCQQEIITPTFPVVKKPIDLILRLKQKLVGRLVKKETSEYLYGVYDLEVAPITYNIIEFLAYIEFLSKEKEKKGFVIVFVPQKEKKIQFISEYERHIDKESQNWRVDNILFQTVRLHPKCFGVLLLPNRNDVIDVVKNHDVFPDLYDGINLRYFDTAEYLKTMSKPGLYDGIKASVQGKRYLEQYLKENKIDKKIVTIVIRDSEYDTARNSNLYEWAKFVDYLLKNDFHPVIIPDTDNAFSSNLPFDPVYIFRDCCWNLGLRMALYEYSYLNLGVANGAICILLHSTSSKVITMNSMPEDSIVSNKSAFDKVGHKPYEQWSFLTSKQKLSFQKDICANIVNEFEQYIELNYPQDL